MTAYQILQEKLRAEPRSWLITGVAGFIGSHLLEALLRLGQRVIGLDNFSTGSPRNLEEVRTRVGDDAWARFDFQEGTVLEIGICREASKQVDYVLHHAGFVSVPLSIEDPVGCHDTNVTGTLNLLVAARDHRVRRFVHASSSAVYGDAPQLPNTEAQIGRPLSPYAASKLMGELYARLFFDHYGLESIGLRYFNIFGPRQNPAGGYAAVIPQWIDSLQRGGQCRINGDGSITRDFCPIDNVVQANLLAATAPQRGAMGGVFNVALGARTTLDGLYALISTKVGALTGRPVPAVEHGPARPGDIPHSGADISRIVGELGFAPEQDVDAGLDETVRWYFAGAAR
ncbi:MAG: UDP-N-acetylglucosamine/UDP-N-acetylgalactosamine 4-epimerase [Chthoniobacter sp.]|jgi:UDP-N-acetylglucosamine 4-epimerase|nr:UDP-N-acetylglucosamine/UDP-N-acetylgalactosamine 4-epimerase [Chthoniobacter sp.]